MNQVRHLSVSIDRSADEAYDFLSDPTNFPKWASGLGGLTQVGGRWIAQTPDGPMQVRFSERNALGVLDHWVTRLPDVQIYIPLRVVANGARCELVLTLFRQPDMDDAKFEADAQWVMKDLGTARRLLEGGA